MRPQTMAMIVILALSMVIPVQADETILPEGETDYAAVVTQSLHESAEALRHYGWIETTVVSIKGDEKARTLKNCTYGFDGKIHKIAFGSSADQPVEKPGLYGMIVEKKSEQVAESLQQAMALVPQYVPPDPARIQAAQKAGRLSVDSSDPSGVIEVAIADYLAPGDSYTIVLDPAARALSAISIASFVDTGRHDVHINVSFASLADGTIHPAATVVDVPARHISVSIENHGYDKFIR